MPLLRFHRRLIAWLALWAVLLGALAPGLAQAVVSGSGQAQWVEVCGASGMVWVKLDSAPGEAEAGSHEPAPGKSMADMASHCPWSQLHGSAGLPPAHAGVAVLPRQTELPAAFYHAPGMASVWAAAHSRAPPAFP